MEQRSVVNQLGGPVSTHAATAKTAVAVPHTSESARVKGLEPSASSVTGCESQVLSPAARGLTSTSFPACTAACTSGAKAEEIELRQSGGASHPQIAGVLKALMTLAEKLQALSSNDRDWLVLLLDAARQGSSLDPMNARQGTVAHLNPNDSA